MKSRDDGNEGFVMVHQHDLDCAVSLVGRRVLELRDMAVLMALMASMNWRSGRVHVTAKGVADQLKIKLPVCVSSLTRLRKQQMISRVMDRHTGENYFLVNPYLVSVGGPKRRGHLWAQFEQSLERDAADG